MIKNIVITFLLSCICPPLGAWYAIKTWFDYREAKGIHEGTIECMKYMSKNNPDCLKNMLNIK